jgi:chromosomal replication initiator protein
MARQRATERGEVVEAHSPAPEWDRFRDTLRGRVTPITWQTWLQDLQPDTCDDDRVVLLAPSEFHLRWVTDKYRSVVEEAFATAFGSDVELIMQARPQPVFVADDEADGDDDLDLHLPPADRPDHPDSLSVLPPKYSFENFVVGPSNRFAHAAAMAIAEQPGGQYNPLFIYGGVGLGKTHILRAIELHCRYLHPHLQVIYATSEHFFNDFIDGIRRKRMDEFKAAYRTIDVFLLDDVQFLEGKEQALEEFFHTFNALHEGGRQLVFSADRPPRDLASLEARIRSRFEWGLTTDIQPPDIETRLAILRKNAEYAPLPVPEPVLGFIADRVVNNIRELEGALTRVTAYAALTHQQITLDMAADVLQDLVSTDRHAQITPSQIIAATAASFGVSVGDVEGASRRQPLARARQVAMYLCRELTDLSLPKIGDHFGRDHTTVLHGVNTVKRLMQTDADLFETVTALLQSLRTT